MQTAIRLQTNNFNLNGNFEIPFLNKLDNLNNLTYEISNYPSIDIKSDTYSPKYEAIIGSFEGDSVQVHGET